MEFPGEALGAAVRKPPEIVPRPGVASLLGRDRSRAMTGRARWPTRSAEPGVRGLRFGVPRRAAALLAVVALGALWVRAAEDTPPAAAGTVEEVPAEAPLWVKPELFRRTPEQHAAEARRLAARDLRGGGRRPASPFRLGAVAAKLEAPPTDGASRLPAWAAALPSETAVEEALRREAGWPAADGADPVPFGPVRIGYERDLAALAGRVPDEADLEWRDTPDGGQAATLAVRSPGAVMVRVQIDFVRAPVGMEVRVYDPDAAAATVAYVPPDEVFVAGSVATGTGLFVAPAVLGDDQAVELYLPPGTPPGALELTVPRVTHLFAEPGDAPAATQAPGAGAACEYVSAPCEAITSDGPRHSTVRMLMNGGTLCTGTLVADADSTTQVPYLFLARHCAPDGIRQLTLYWRHEGTQCGGLGEARGANVQSNVGVEVLARSRTVRSIGGDWMLLRLGRAPPDGIPMSGWTSERPSTNARMVHVSHPGGGVKRWGTATFSGVTHTHHIALLDHPVTGGSSGSGAWIEVDGTNYLVGAALAGTAQPGGCLNAYWARMDKVYPAVHSWLGAAGNQREVFTRLEVLDGRTGDVLATLASGDSATIDLTDRDTDSFNVRAALREGIEVGSVRFAVGGDHNMVGVAHGPPFALFRDGAFAMSNGFYSVVATAYQRGGGLGQVWLPFGATFDVTGPLPESRDQHITGLSVVLDRRRSIPATAGSRIRLYGADVVGGVELQANTAGRWGRGGQIRLTVTGQPTQGQAVHLERIDRSPPATIDITELRTGAYQATATLLDGDDVAHGTLLTVDFDFVCCLNSEPVFDSEAVSFNLAEEPGPGKLVGEVPATDADGDGLTYTLEGSDARAFAISRSGRIETIYNERYDYETGPGTYSFVVRASDGEASATVMVTVVVEDGPEPPLPPAFAIFYPTPGSDTALTVRWHASPAIPGRAAERYELQYRASDFDKLTSEGSWTPVPAGNVQDTSAEIRALEPGRIYQVQIRAHGRGRATSWQFARPRDGAGTFQATRFTPIVYARAAAANIHQAETVRVHLARFTTGDLSGGYRLRQVVLRAGSRTTDHPRERRLGLRILKGGGTLDVDRPEPALGIPGPGPDVLVSWTADEVRTRQTHRAPNEHEYVPVTNLHFHLLDVAAGQQVLLEPATTYWLELTRAADGRALPMRDNDDTSGAPDWSIGAVSFGKDDPAAAAWTRYEHVPIFGIDAEAAEGPEYANAAVRRSVAENAPAGSPVGAPVVASGGGGADAQYSLSGTDHRVFDIDAVSGQILVKTPLDYEAPSPYLDEEPDGLRPFPDRDELLGVSLPDRTTYSLVVVATRTGAQAAVDVTVDVTDELEPPAAPDLPTLEPRQGTRDTLIVRWNEPANTGPPITGYRLRSRVSGAGAWREGPQDVQTLDAEIGDLSDALAYEVQVRADNDEGAGAWSAPALGSPGETMVSIAPPPLVAEHGYLFENEGTTAGGSWTVTRDGHGPLPLTVNLRVGDADADAPILGRVARTLLRSVKSERFIGTAEAQGAKPTRKRPLPAPTGRTFSLPAPTAGERAAQLDDTEPPVGPTVELMGYGRDFDALSGAVPTADGLDWRPLRDGGLSAAMAVGSPGAAALRALLEFSGAPAGMQVRFSSPSAPAEAVTVPPAELFANGTAQTGTASYWSPPVEGDEIRIEIELPPGSIASDLRLAVPRVSHMDVHPANLEHIGAAASCDLLADAADAVCASTDKLQANLRHSVAKLLYTTRSGATGRCSGTLLNDYDAATQIPYLLTAEHCVPSNAVANSMVFYWFFERDSCDGEDPATVTRTLGGGQLMTSSGLADAALLRLNREPPADTWLSGWTTATMARGDRLVAVHHPGGDLKKLGTSAMLQFWPQNNHKGMQIRALGDPIAGAAAAAACGAAWAGGTTWWVPCRDSSGSDAAPKRDWRSAVSSGSTTARGDGSAARSAAPTATTCGTASSRWTSPPANCRRPSARSSRTRATSPTAR